MNKLCIILTLLLVGCDVDVSEPLTEDMLSQINVICDKNLGFKNAVRARQVIRAEWRVDCKDGAKFIIPVKQFKSSN